jgi:multidrug resistance efflux pump
MNINFNRIEKSKTPKSEDGFKVEYDAPKRNTQQLRWYLLLITVLAPVALVLWLLLKPYFFILAPGIITTEPLEIRSGSKGIVQSIDATEGQVVESSQKLITLVDADINAHINELESQLAQLQDPVMEFDQGIITQLKNRITIAKEGSKKQAELLTIFEGFQKKGVIPAIEMAAALQVFTASKMTHEQATVDLMKEQQRQKLESVAGTIAKAKNQLQVDLVRLNAKKASLEIRSPLQSRVVDILVQLGEQISDNQPLALISGRPQPVILVFLNPKYLDHVFIGQKARFKLPIGEKISATITEPTELVSKIPQQRSGPFDGEKSALKVTLSPNKKLSQTIEGIPVEVTFDSNW